MNTPLRDRFRPVSVARPGRARRATLVVAAVLALVALTSACLPAQPSTGRSTPVRKVLVLGDSVSYGLFGTTPRVHAPLSRLMADRGVSLHVTGFPGENPLDHYPQNFPWILRMQHEISTWNPDMVVIQSTLFPDSGSAQRQAQYRKAMDDLITVAKSRGAHVYLVSHHRAPNASDARNRDIAQRIQAAAAAGKGVSTIPLDWWMARCAGGTVADGWHLSAKGQDCHALAIASAVDQLRDAVG